MEEQFCKDTLKTIVRTRREVQRKGGPCHRPEKGKKGKRKAS